MGRGGGFIGGTATGAGYTLIGGVAVLYVLGIAGVVGFPDARLPGFESAVDWVTRNLGLSLPVFCAVGLFFAHSLSVLRRRLSAGDTADRVAQAEHMADIWISLFFGVGVIWTAIGMRGALLYALGDTDDTLSAGAFAVLQRMVDGGILTALSTTIFGGGGGYLLRIVKLLSTGAALKRYYEDARREPDVAMRASLDAIEQRVADLGTARPEARDE